MWGWWTVNADGDIEYYYFGLAGFVDWTDQRPANRSTPIFDPRNRGIFTVRGNELVITWNEVGGTQTVETFHADAAHRNMTGTSNRGYGLTARKM